MFLAKLSLEYANFGLETLWKSVLKSKAIF